jgi:prepilin-type N-terminal cleavage/methylation domain-containing protein
MMKKKVLRLLTSNSGFSLVEILAAIVLLALIVGPFLTMFIQSAQTNQVTQKVDDATFVANSEMEYLYNLSTNFTISLVPNNIGSSYQSTTQNCVSGATCFTKTATGHYIFIQLKPVSPSPLEDVEIKVYKTQAMNQLQAQMESVYSWKT